MKVIYVAGPFRADSAWDVEQNVRKAEEAALKLWRKGWAVICPHTNTRFFQGAVDDSIWLRGDLEIITRCDAIYMLKGWEKSFGATKELGLAKELELEVLYES